MDQLVGLLLPVDEGRSSSRGVVVSAPRRSILSQATLPSSSPRQFAGGGPSGAARSIEHSGRLSPARRPPLGGNGMGQPLLFEEAHIKALFLPGLGSGKNSSNARLVPSSGTCASSRFNSASAGDDRLQNFTLSILVGTESYFSRSSHIESVWGDCCVSGQSSSSLPFLLPLKRS